MVEIKWHGHKAVYGPPHGDQSHYCGWTSEGYPDDLPWPPPRPQGYVCPHNHVACSSWPDASGAEIRARFAELLKNIGAKPGTYVIKGHINPDPRYAYTECVIWEEVVIK